MLSVRIVGSLLPLLLLTFALPPAFSATIRVPVDWPTIQAGIDAANESDTVLVASGLYVGPGNRNMSFAGKNLVLCSEAGVESTIIALDADNVDPARAISFQSGETGASIVQGFTIRNGYWPSQAGAILCHGASPTIRDCVFLENRAAGGGAMYIVNSSSIVEGCVFTGNEAYNGQGGAIASATTPALVIAECSFVENAGTEGGGVSCGWGSSARISKCQFLSNARSGLYCRVANVVIDGCTFTFNSTPGLGGAVSTASSDLFVTGCTFFANTSDGAADGAGIHLGIWSSIPSAATIENTIIAFSTVGDAISCQVPSTAVLSCCDVFGNEGGDWVSCIAGQLHQRGNISQDPLFCDAPGGNLALSAASPCAPANSPPGCGLIGAVGVGCGATGITDEASAILTTYLRVRPNPVNGVAEFEILSMHSRVLEIYDVSGRLIEQIPLVRAASRVVWVARESTPPGVYFAATGSADGRAAVKFLLLKR
jgi:hypothetical protein